MAINNGSEKIVKYKDEFGFTDRDIHWIWNTYQLHLYNPFTQHNAINQKREIIKNHINLQPNRDYFLNNIIIQKDTHLTNESEFNWINKTNQRLLIILINIIIKEYNVNLINPPTTNNYVYFINIFDSIPLAKDTKINILNNLKSIWSNIEINKYDINWIHKINLDQIIWAWDYLKKNNKLAYFPTPPALLYERYEYICASIDLIGYSNNQEAKELFLLKMKKTWAQKKYRDSGKIKKPHHLPLSKESHRKLKELGDIFNKPLSEVLEFTIDKLYEDYINDSQGKNKF